MNKKGIGTAAIISIILGLIVIASMGGVLWKNKAFIAEKIFGKEILPTPPGEGEFVPYEIEYTEEELQIMDSMNALTCAINSIAVGKFDPSDTRLCPEQKKEEKETKPAEEQKEETPEVSLSSITGFFAKITGMASSDQKVAKYGDVEVSCTGKRVRTIYLGSKDGKKIHSWKEDYAEFIEPSVFQMQVQNNAVKQIGDAILDCWMQFKDVEDKESYYKCDILNAYPLLGIQEKDDKRTYSPIVIDEDWIIIYLNQIIASNDYRKSAAEELLSTWQGVLYKGTNRIRIMDTPISNSDYKYCAEDADDTETDNICGKASRSFGRNTYCVYFDTGETIVTRDVITIADCREYIARDTFACNVKNFHLPQEITEEGSWNPLTWVAGYNDPKYIAYYEAFPDGMDKFWHVDGISMVTVGLIVGTAVFDLVPLVGKGAGKVVSGILRKGGKEVGEEVAKQTAKTGLREFLENLAKKGVKRTVKKELVTESLEGIGGGVSRKVAGEAADIVDNKLPGLFKRMRAKISPKYRQKLINDLATDFKKLDLSDAVPDEAFAKNFVDDAAKKAGKPDVDALFKEKELLDSYNADDIMTEFDVEVWEKEFQEQVGKSIKEVQDDVVWLSKTQKEMAEAYPDKLARDMAEESFEGFTKKISKAEARRYAQKMAVKRFMKGMFSEGFEKMSKEQIQQNMDEAFKKFSSLGLLGRRRAVNKAAELSKELIDADGFIDFSKIAGKPITDPKLKSQLTMDFMDAITTTQGMQITGAMKKAGFTAAKGLKKGTVGPGKVSWVFDLFALPRFYRIGKSAFVKPDTLINKVPIIRQFTWVGRVPAKTVGELGGWMKSHKYAVIALLALYGSAQDAAGEKFRPVGINSLGVDMPYIYSDPAPWDLVNETQDFYIAPMDQGGDLRHQRLYLVSPCKATLTVSKGLVECHRMQKGVQHYQFGEYSPPMDVKGVVLDMERLTDDEFVYDYFNKTRGYEENIQTMSEQEKKEYLDRVVTSIKNLGSENQYLFIRHPYLRDLVLKKHKINFTDLKEALIARDQMFVVNFFDEHIAGYLGGGEKQLYHVGEETATLSQQVWKTYEPFFNLEGVTKECFSRDGWTDAIDWTKVAFAGEAVEDDPLKHPAFKAEGITVKIHRNPGEDANYCIDEYPYVDTLRYVSLAVQVVASVAITAATGGAAAPVTTALFLATASVGGGFAEEWIASNAKWPAHNKEGLPPSLGGEGLPIAKK